MKKMIFPKRNYVFLFFGLIVLLLLIEISKRLQMSIENIFSMKTPGFLKNNLSAYLSFTFTVLPILLVEIILPNDEISKDHRHGALFWLISIQCNYFYSFLSIGIINHFNIGPVFNLSFNSLSVNSFFNPLLLNVLLVVLTLVVFDFFYYWFHRMQHTFSFFWEFHKIHHSIKNLNSIVSYHHVLEEFFRIPFITIPIAILIKIDAPTLAILSSFFAVYGQFIHMNSKINLGPLRLFFADNYYHRIHHSLEESHHNKNYSAFFPLWDILFKTVHFPRFNEFPQVGLTDMEQPKTLKDYLFSPKPFRKELKFPVSKETMNKRE
jgi:sterol desaturase/sphingolipid hydroxylase (fatty acid hydroxylase superfamily)